MAGFGFQLGLEQPEKVVGSGNRLANGGEVNACRGGQKKRRSEQSYPAKIVKMSVRKASNVDDPCLLEPTSVEF
jgi:hypothetical protein